MSQGINFISNSIPGYGPSKGRCLLCLGVSGRSAPVLSYICHGDFKPYPQVKVLLMKSPFFACKRTSLVCSANSSSHRRNPDFSRQNKQNHGFSRSKKRQNFEKDSTENLEESELLSSKNGPLLSLPTSPRFQSTSTPGPREKEIVELFRKVQAQLRERAAIKEEKKIEASQGQGKESETVDSLLKLLRKHSFEQGKRRSNDGGEFVLEQSEQNSLFPEEQNTSLFGSNTITKEEYQEPNTNPFRRPVSNFRRKSPVPRVKYQPVYSAEDGISSSASPSMSQGRRKKVVEPEPEPISPVVHDEVFDEILDTESSEPVSLDVHDEVFDDTLESESSDIDEDYDDEVVETPSSSKPIDLSSLKLLELRVLAKSRGVKGYSKLKKGELVELLSG